MSEKFSKPEIMEKLNEIYDLEDDGICSSCAYGIDKCLKDGQAHCKEKENGKQERTI